MFQPGDLAVIKSTGEEVTILDVHAIPANSQERGNVINMELLYHVRRPQITRDGIIHNVESFGSLELETKLDSLRRDLESMKARADLIKEYESLAKPLATPTTRAN